MRFSRFVFVALCLAALGACEVAEREPAVKRDTATLPVGGAALDTVPRTDTTGVPAVPSDTSAGAGIISDSGTVEIYPAQPRRGGVLYAFASGLVMQVPRCSWNGAPLPCYSVSGGVLATVPLSADDAPGRYVLTIDRPAGRIVRTITVADRELGREVVLLSPELYALVKRGSDVARDARAARQVMSVETPERAWTGKWRDPIAGVKGSGYGAERFYFPASDSSRVLNLDPASRARGPFGGDTASATAKVPSWRHSGVDMPAAKGTRVLAPANGVVADVGDYTLTGHTLILDHGHGVFTAYFHLDTTTVRRGDQVKAGRVIARVGSTGLSTGPHLHYGVYVHGKDVDPAAWRDMPVFAQGGKSPAASGN